MSLPPDVLTALIESLIVQGEAVLATKKQPPSRVRGDWQSTETVYAVVEEVAFKAWQAAVLEAFNPNPEAQQAFHQACRVPRYLEVLEGLKWLKRQKVL